MRKLLLLVIALWLAGCSAPSGSPSPLPSITPAAPAFSLQNVFKGTDAISGWTADGEARFYTSENLFDRVDGQADAFFAYGMRQVAVRRYVNAVGKRMDAEVWQLGTPADAYGLYTAGISGQPTAMGNEGDIETGLRLSFWQESFVVHVGARQKMDDTLLTQFASAIAGQLPQGGKRPDLVDRLPQAGLEPRRFIFFHKEISVQDQLWLGGKNILALGADTDCLLARYDLNGTSARLLIVHFPTATRATLGLNALKTAKVADMQAARAHDTLLGAVFGKVDSQAAQSLLDQALVR